MKDRKSINVQLVELVRDLAEKAKEAGFILTTVAFDVPGSIGGGYEKMRVEFQNSLHNVKEHAPPLAGASDETGVGVHDTGEVDDKSASGGCCVSTCSAI